MDVETDQKCGTTAGFQRHRRLKTKPCPDCVDARNQRRRALAAEKRSRRPPKPDTTSRRFWEKVARRGPDQCWVWTGYKDRLGYGRLSVGGRGGRMVGAHRISWELNVGPIPHGLDMDHLCRNPSCVNPSHLEPVTHKENIRRGVTGEVNRARQLAISHCPKGHEYNELNTGRTTKGTRRCRQCAREYARGRYVAKTRRV